MRGHHRQRVDRLEIEQHEYETPNEREKRLRMIREGADQMNGQFFRELARERRGSYLESVGHEGHSADDLRDENFLYADDVPPFEITSSGEVFCTRDGRPVRDFHQILAEVFFWVFHDDGRNPRGLIYDEERQAYYMPDPPHELAFSRDRCYLPRYFWAIGDPMAAPYCITVGERLDTT